jgi:hypothetical protein
MMNRGLGLLCAAARSRCRHDGPGYEKSFGPAVPAKIHEDGSMMQPQIDKLVVAITKAIGSESARAFRTAFAAAPDDNPEDYAFIATIAWIANERLPASDRVDRVAVLINLARPA